VVSGTTGTAEYGIVAPQAAEQYAENSGALVADDITARLSTESQVVIYSVPELTFTGVSADATTKEPAKVCPGCSTRAVDTPIATVGNTAPITVVRDLQVHPETTTAVFPANEVSSGVLAALAAAGLNVRIPGAAPGPADLQTITDGKQVVGLDYDAPVAA